VPESWYIEKDSSRREVIVFVHGVTGDSRDTWTNGTTKAYWPSLIRGDGQRFSAANVWIFSYSSPKVHNAQTVSELAIKLSDALAEVLRDHDRLYFIAHSMGGLIVREMLVLKSLPATKVPLIYFYGTPSAGADLAGIAAAISSNPQFENLRPYTRGADVEAYARNWLATAEDPRRRYPQKVWSFCAYEIQGMVGDKVIVPQLSASYLCSTAPRGSLANHATMVKPKSAGDEPYEYFASAYAFARTEAATLVASAGAIRAHSAGKPGIDVTTLEVLTATAAGIEVPCGQSRTGSVVVPTKAMADKKVLAAVVARSEVQGLRGGKFEAKLLPDGLFVQYAAAGPSRHPVRGCAATTGRADVQVKYVLGSQ